MTDNPTATLSKQYLVIRELIKEKTGIYIRDTRSDYLEYRVEERMDANSIEDIEEYYYFLKYSPSNSGEFQALINLVTVQETSFFRNSDQLESFKNVILKNIIDKKTEEGSNNLKIWSAASSTGEEPITLSMIINEALTYFFNWNVEILATDISTRALDLAKKGEYPEHRFKTMSPLIRTKFFSKVLDGYKANEMAMAPINYRHLNLSGDLNGFNGDKVYDVIFCRNVFIYFTDDVKEKIANHFYKILRPGGYLLLGNAESIDIRKVPFKMAFLPGGMVYQKP
ncbi:MAG: protein-glutamate O-methyltransferase CheR [Deltaproteobacteria bacterium]|nr:protein-glutamate O-methyltransferase CheR [Deltaproteobacteria bacterium]